jgi:hypothetical protein
MAIPASGVVSNGYMRADGVAIPANNAVSGTPPNLSTSIFLRGASTFGGTGGGTATLIAANIPSLTSTGTVTNTGTTVATNTGTEGSHTHGAGSYTTNASLTGSTTFASSGHDHYGTTGYADQQYICQPGGATNISVPNRAIGGSPGYGSPGQVIVNHTSGPLATASVGISNGGITGTSGTPTATHLHTIPILTVNSGQAVSVTSTGTSGSATGNAFNVVPNYIDVIYLVRVN